MDTSKLAGVRVLVLEDDDETRMLTLTVLSQAGAKVRGVASVDALWKCFDDYCPHVIVSDIAMPGLSGLDMMKEMRERRAEDGGLTSVVALTGRALAGQRQEGLRTGFDRYLTKPIDVDVLIDTVAELAPTRARGVS
jgi:CheY-like chemotaxis protein